ncbi:hypothetical protein [Fusobacterium sp. MFO224]|uniref:hypothetical protein n=1 Tax=Fusobacterium sp. MFO224 TaxID=3378070 RepID=UPI003851BA7A
MSVNKYGLSRNIPEKIKKVVRQKSGFGCVICGAVPYEYEHVNPEFKNAKEHDSSCITLLCPNCHSKVTKKIISKEKVKKHMESPYNLKYKEEFIKGYEFEINSKKENPFTVKLGGLTAVECKNFLYIEGKAVLKFNKSEDGEEYFINANFKNSKGKSILRIVNNEWQSSKKNWDIKLIGTRISIQDKENHYGIVINKPKENLIEIEKLDIEHRGVRIYFDSKEEEAIFTYGKMKFSVVEGYYKDCTYVLRIENNSVRLEGDGPAWLKGVNFYK